MEEWEPALAQSLRAHRSDVNCVDFCGTSRLATASGDKTVRLWSWSAGLGFVEAEHSPARGHKYGVLCVRYSPQGTMLASCSIDGTTRVWCARDARSTHRLLQPSGHGVRACRFTADSRHLVTGADDGSVCVWDLLQKHLVRRVAAHEGAVQALSACAEGALLLTSCTLGVLKLYALRELVESEEQTRVSELCAQDDAHDLGVLAAAAAPRATDLIEGGDEEAWRTCRVATGGQDGRVRVWSAEWRTGQKATAAGAGTARLRAVFTLEGHTSAVTCVCWSVSSAALASASVDKTVRLWSARAGRCTRVLDAHDRYVNTVAFSQYDLIMATGSNDKSVRVWSLRGALSLDSELEPPCSLLSHFASGDLEGIGPAEGALAALGGERGEAALLWSDRTSHSAAVNCVVFSGERTLATACSDRLVRVFRWSDLEAALEEACAPLAAHRYPVTAVNFHPSGGALLSASLDGTAIVWDVETGCRLSTLSVEAAGGTRGEVGAGGGGARDARLSPHRADTLILVASDDHVAPCWRLADRSAVEPAHVYRGHTDAVSCCAWAPDGSLLVTASHNGDFRVYTAPPPVAADGTEPPAPQPRQLHVQDDAHDLGVQSCDFASSASAVSSESGALLLATAGNDSLAKLWLLLPHEDGDVGGVRVRAVRALAGHGGNVLCVRFSPAGELVATAATDKHARVWCSSSGRCVAAVAHEGGAAACALSSARLLAVGCLDGELALWRLPPPTASEGVNGEGGEEAAWCGAAGAGAGRGPLRSWTRDDLAAWLHDHVLRAPELAGVRGEEAGWGEALLARLRSSSLDGARVTAASVPSLLLELGCEEEGGGAVGRVLAEELEWLRARERVRACAGGAASGEPAPPHHLLCPVTHQLMLEPVKCADGFTYERAAILEWFLAAGKLVSPMTNQPLLNAELSPNYELKRAIRRHLLGAAPHPPPPPPAGRRAAPSAAAAPS